MDKRMIGVTEYGEGMDVTFDYENGRPIVVARNEGGYNSTAVDLIELLDWVYKNKPDLYAPRPAWADLAQLEINPEPRPWVGLTDDEIDRLEDAIDPAMYRVFARRVEALLREKNS